MGAFLAVQGVNFSESAACQSAMGAAVRDGPGEPTALMLPHFKNFCHCQPPAQLTARSV